MSRRVASTAGDERETFPQTSDGAVIPADVLAEVLAGRDLSKCLEELEEVPISTLWPQSSTLRALASLLTVDDIQVNKAAASYLSSGASSGHFKARVSALVCFVFCFFLQCQRTSNPTRLFLFLFLSVRLQAVEYYTQALSEAGGQSQRAACSALSCLQVSGLATHTTGLDCGLQPAGPKITCHCEWSIVLTRTKF